MWEYSILLLTNCAVLVCRSFEIRSIAANKPWNAALSQILLTTMWLISVQVGLGAVLRGDYLMWAAYIVAAMVGSFWGTYYKREAPLSLDLDWDLERLVERLDLELISPPGDQEGLQEVSSDENGN